MKCPICGGEHPDDVQICTNTGEQLKKMCLNRDCSYYRERIFGLDMDTCPCCGRLLFTTPHEYVDLGLSVKWAKYNVGADDSNEGSLFAWGSLVPNCSYSKKEEYNCEVGHCYIQPDEDIATKEWGDYWRIPTRGEWEELISSCDLEWVHICGMEFVVRLTSRINGESIILPVCGFIKGCKRQYQRDMACYWSSSADDDNYSANCFCFSRSEYKPYVHISQYSEYRGVAFSIRPVFGKRPSTSIPWKRLKEIFK